MKKSVAPKCPYQDRCFLMGLYREGRPHPKGMCSLTKDFITETCDTTDWRNCSEQYQYWKEDQMKIFNKKKVCPTCGKNVSYDPVGDKFLKHWCSSKTKVKK